jgi:hypothetical protein
MTFDELKTELDKRFAAGRATALADIARGAINMPRASDHRTWAAGYRDAVQHARTAEEVSR